MANGQTTLDELKQKKEIAEAEKAANDAQTALIESKKKLEEAIAGPSASQTKTAAEVASASNAKAIADAKKAQTDAELAALQAKMTVPSSGITGTVTANTGAAGLETALLASRATATAATKIVKIVQPRSAGKKIFIFSPGEVPDFQAASAFQIQKLAITSALSEAAKLGGLQPAPGQTESPAAVGIALEAVTKLLGFFKSDFTVAGTELTPDNQLLQQEVAGQLALSNAQVYMYSLYSPTPSNNGKLPTELLSLDFPRKNAAAALVKLDSQSNQLTNEIAQINDALPAEKSKKIILTSRLKETDSKVLQIKAALSAYDAFLARTFTSDGAAAALLRQLRMLDELTQQNSILLMVKLNKAGGSSYIEKNLWTTFGAMPYKVAGGAIASFSAFDSATGTVLAAQTIHVHGGFSNVNKVGELFP
jgi:hypothetical protein